MRFFKIGLFSLLFSILFFGQNLWATDYGFDRGVWYRVAGTGTAKSRFLNGTDRFNKNDRGIYILFGILDTFSKVKRAVYGDWSVLKTQAIDGFDILTRTASSYEAMEAYLDDKLAITWNLELDIEFWYAVVFIPY
ncbi:hypothetical protein P0082_08915 [Candidatus Haliotispira prima]|uniref:Uncharacterized protein n=1 Tax=Candidatus Haliotispira prima TaxID=3034016 RepID=A0ABY8MFB8_9SPIO|nr:hypothetical protein P0082_08915 [Candidatus Haliotispira prima]